MIANGFSTEPLMIKIKIRDAYNEINSMKNDLKMMKFKEVVLATKKLDKKVDLRDWNNTRESLLKIEVPISLINKFYIYIQAKDFSNYTINNALKEFLDEYFRKEK